MLQYGYDPLTIPGMSQAAQDGAPSEMAPWDIQRVRKEVPNGD